MQQKKTVQKIEIANCEKTFLGIFQKMCDTYVYKYLTISTQ